MPSFFGLSFACPAESQAVTCPDLDFLEAPAAGFACPHDVPLPLQGSPLPTTARYDPLSPRGTSLATYQKDHVPT